MLAGIACAGGVMATTTCAGTPGECASVVWPVIVLVVDGWTRTPVIVVSDLTLTSTLRDLVSV